MTEQTTTTTPINETPAQRRMREARALMAEAQAALEQEEKEAADAIAAEVATIDTELAEIGDKIKPLWDRQQELLKRKNELVPPQAPPAQAQPQAAATTTNTSTSGDKKWKTEKYMFWRAYQTAFKAYPDTPSHSQSVLSATCKLHNISMTIPDVATLNRVRDIITRTTR